MRSSVLVFAAFAAIPAAASPVRTPPSVQMKQAIMSAVSDKLKDGPTARYRWLPEDRNGVGYCGFVNAKNSFGGYSGWTPFFVIGAHAASPNGNGKYLVASVHISDAATEGKAGVVEQMCMKEGFDISSVPPETS